MFSRSKAKLVHVELSDESKEALSGLDNDIQALVGLVDELVATHTKILEAIRGEVAVLVADAAGVAGVRVFEDEERAERQLTLAELPDVMTKRGYDNSDDPDRVRDSPFTRAPRSTQVEWLLQVIADGAWYAPIRIARETANDERHYRYLRHAIGGRFREMHEDGLVERRDSHVKGSMYEYRVKPKEEG